MYPSLSNMDLQLQVDILGFRLVTEAGFCLRSVPLPLLAGPGPSLPLLGPGSCHPAQRPEDAILG